MSLPPTLTSVGGLAIDDERPFVDLTRAVGVGFQLRLEGSDPEGDPLTWRAQFLVPGMTFDPPSRTFSWTPPHSALGRTFNVRFEVTTPSGGVDYAIARITVGSTTGVDASLVPPLFAITAIRPNPTSAGATIEYGLETIARVRLELFDLSGRRVRRLVDDELPPGPGAATWDGTDDRGRRVAPGLYVCRLSAKAQGAARAHAARSRMVTARSLVVLP